MGIAETEINNVKKLYQNNGAPEGLRVVSSTSEHIRIEISKSKIKTIVAMFQFPPEYPSSSVLIELRSKTIDTNLLSKLTLACEQETKKYLGKLQLIPAIEFLKKFIEDNPLCCCANEISELKRNILNDSKDEVKLKQKNSAIVLNLNEGLFYHKVQATIPENYPDSRVLISVKESNFPNAVQRYLQAQGKELARRCVEPPLNKNKKPKANAPPFQPQPSLLSVVSFIVSSVHDFPNQNCSFCSARCFPENPVDVVNDEQHDLHVERVYCGHLYHLKCLVEYMKTPPFNGGKKCLKCGQRIFSEKYKISPELSESRWAHMQARERELSEVAEFLS